MNLTNEAQQGFNEPERKCPYYATSPSEMAWAVGRWMAQTGRTRPYDCRTSRGYTMHINGMKVSLNYVDGVPAVERIA
jgi:hypothetical protein